MTTGCWRAALLLWLAASAGCSGQAPRDAPAAIAPLRVQGQGYEGVILPADAAGDTSVETEGTGVPTAEQVREAESLLAAYVRAEAKERASDLWSRLPDYHRQYLGTIHGGRRCIYVNPVLRACWREGEGFGGDSRLIEVCDGGESYVQAEFDPDARRYLRLGINGEA